MPHDKHHGSRVRDIHKIVLEVTEEINLDSDDDEEEGVCQLNEQCSLERELEGQMDVQEDDGEGVEKEEEVVMMEGVMYSEEDMGDNVGSSKEEGSSKKGSSKGVKRDHDAVVGGDDVEERQSEVDPMPPSAKRVRVFQKAKRSRPQAGSSHCEERVGDAMSHPMACLGVSQNCTMQPSMPVIGTSDMIHSAPGPNGAMEIKMKVVLRDIKMESGHSIVSLSAGSGVWGDLRSKKGSSITRIKSANPISLEGCSGITLEPLVSYSMPDRGGGGVGTMIHMKDCSNMRVVCSSFVSEHACGAVAICLQGCTNITIEGCGFYGCGVSIMDGCSMIDISSCR